MTFLLPNSRKILLQIGSSFVDNCTLVKDGNEYFVATLTVYSSNRSEIFEKVDLQNAVEFAGPEYAQNYISARWSDGDGWVTADNDAHDQPYRANDHNNHVFWTGYCFLDYGYNKVNHTHENGVQYKQSKQLKLHKMLCFG